MMKKRYISPATNIVQMFEMESGILYDSFVTKNVFVDESHNMNADSEVEEKYFIEF